MHSKALCITVRYYINFVKVDRKKCAFSLFFVPTQIKELGDMQTYNKIEKGVLI